MSLKTFVCQSQLKHTSGEKIRETVRLLHSNGTLLETTITHGVFRKMFVNKTIAVD